MRALLWMPILSVAFACGHDDTEHEDGHGGASGTATCDDIAAATGDHCGATFDAADCVTQCTAQSHPSGHLSSVHDQVMGAADCNAALQILADEDICS